MVPVIGKPVEAEMVDVTYYGDVFLSKKGYDTYIGEFSYDQAQWEISLFRLFLYENEQNLNEQSGSEYLFKKMCCLCCTLIGIPIIILLLMGYILFCHRFQIHYNIRTFVINIFIKYSEIPWTKLKQGLIYCKLCGFMENY